MQVFIISGRSRKKQMFYLNAHALAQKSIVGTARESSKIRKGKSVGVGSKPVWISDKIGVMIRRMTSGARRKLEGIFSRLFFGAPDIPPPVKVDIEKQFTGGRSGDAADFRRLNAAFLIATCGEGHPLYEGAMRFLKEAEKDARLRSHAVFYRRGLDALFCDIENAIDQAPKLAEATDELYAWVSSPSNLADEKETAEKARKLFFPEGSGIEGRREEMTEALRKRRRIAITRLNPQPIEDPARELLFTANALLTLPPASANIDELNVSRSLKEKIRRAMEDEQSYWYDHPVQIGVKPEANEVIYGLRGLEEAFVFEKKRGTARAEGRLKVLLSLSVTHKSLRGAGREYFEEEIKRCGGFPHLEVYFVTEAEAMRLMGEVLAPAASKYLGVEGAELLSRVIGVDGEYGRHYSFLKAASALFSVLIDPAIRGTFKIDLDQVFPQRELVEHFGWSAFDNFRTPLWGAEGVDHAGRAVELGMIAGALVNYGDIRASVLTPDVDYPKGPPVGDELVFWSRLPQALSTRAEMMTRYGRGEFDGERSCIQRFHVTGGTTGILVSSLRKFRPFTPTFIGRAEDQAYIMSVLMENEEKNLRYLHKDGLIMRHDKETFAQEAIKTAATGKAVADYARTILFSAYARILPASTEAIKEELDPFTGCFISRMPVSVTYLRLALKAASLFASPGERERKDGAELIRLGTRRLASLVKEITKTENPYRKRFHDEKRAWDIFYDTLDRLEEGTKENDGFALDMREKARALAKSWMI